VFVGWVTAAAEDHVGAAAHRVVLSDVRVAKGAVDEMERQELVRVAVDREVGLYPVGDGIENELGGEVASTVGGDEASWSAGKSKLEQSRQRPGGGAPMASTALTMLPQYCFRFAAWGNTHAMPTNAMSLLLTMLSIPLSWLFGVKPTPQPLARKGVYRGPAPSVRRCPR
jgi:hypothetical protein